MLKVLCALDCMVVQWQDRDQDAEDECSLLGPNGFRHHLSCWSSWQTPFHFHLYCPSVFLFGVFRVSR